MATSSPLSLLCGCEIPLVCSCCWERQTHRSGSMGSPLQGMLRSHLLMTAWGWNSSIDALPDQLRKNDDKWKAKRKAEEKPTSIKQEIETWTRHQTNRGLTRVGTICRPSTHQPQRLSWLDTQPTATKNEPLQNQRAERTITTERLKCRIILLLHCAMFLLLDSWYGFSLCILIVIQQREQSVSAN